MRTFGILVLAMYLCLIAAGCGSNGPGSNNNNANANGAPPPERVCSPISDTPTAAYTRLFDAVKAKDTERIKGEFSVMSQEFAESIAARQKNTLEKVYVNGFTGTTMAATLPEIRDERILGCWGGVEVRNEKEGRWEDLPFVNENGAWRFAIGELFSGEFKSPGKGQDRRYQEAANAMRPPQQPVNMMEPNANMNANVNVNKGPKYDGPQVEPLPKKK